jgi:Plasmid pRiA4b ORF-3-like protein
MSVDEVLVERDAQLTADSASPDPGAGVRQLHLRELSRAADSLQHRGGEIGEVSLRKPFARGTVDDCAQRSMDGVRRSCRAEHSGRRVDELRIEVDIRAPDLRLTHLATGYTLTTSGDTHGRSAARTGSVGVLSYGADASKHFGLEACDMAADIGRGTAHGSEAAMQLKLSLRGVSKPPVWRRLLVPADMRLDRLHDVVRTSMGWTDTHLHVFSTAAGDYGVPDPELGFRNERTARLGRFLNQQGDRIQYKYDFGDGWEHDLVLEKRLDPEPKAQIPACLAGKGACPPEDCGGPWGYADLKETLDDPRHDDHADMLDWLGLDSAEHFDPGACDLVEINEVLEMTLAAPRR